MLIESNSDHEGVSDRAAPPSGTRLLHRLFTRHVEQRRPLSSRRTSLQASLSERAGELRKKGRPRIPRYFIDRASVERLKRAGRLRQRVRFTSLMGVTRALPIAVFPASRLACCRSLCVDPNQSAQSSLRIFLTSRMAGSLGCGAIVKLSSRHIRSIGSFSRKTSPTSSPMPRCRAMSMRRLISRYPTPRPCQSLRTAIAYSARNLSGSAKKCAHAERYAVVRGRQLRG
jgi:hypothetical protein